MPDIEPVVNSAPQSMFDDRARFILAIVVILQFVAFFAYQIYARTPLPDGQILTGAEIGFFSGVIGYYFGSSSGSKQKDHVINTMGSKL